MSRRVARDGGWAIVALGALLAGAFLANFLHEIRTLDVVGPPLLALLLGLGLAAGVAGAGLVVLRSEMSVRDTWLVVGWTGGGFLLATTANALTVLIRVAEGRPPGEPQLGVLVGGGTGALAGALLGILHAQHAEAKRSAERSRESLRFLNSLLRHELLNGLTIVAGNASRLEGDLPPDAEAAADRCAVIEDRSEEMAELVRDLRPVARTFGGDESLEAVDLSAVLRERVESARKTFPDAEIAAEIPDGVTVRATDAVSHVFENLVVNAIEHNTGETARVRVTVDSTADPVVVTVADDGPGIPEAERETLFEADDDGGAHGVGLYIVGSLVEQFDGDVEVGESEMGGAAFTVTLPSA
ncbi:MAG: ATP-binding protein [Halobacteriaceae archaeon]